VFALLGWVGFRLDVAAGGPLELEVAFSYVSGLTFDAAANINDIEATLRLPV
jgi:hypothetical protein